MIRTKQVLKILCILSSLSSAFLLGETDASAFETNTPKASWRIAGKLASRVYRAGNAGEAERLLRSAIAQALDQKVKEETVLNLKISLFEVLIAEGKLKEAEFLYQKCSDEIRELNLEEEPILLRLERLKLTLLESQKGDNHLITKQYEEILRLMGIMGAASSKTYRQQYYFYFIHVAKTLDWRLAEKLAKELRAQIRKDRYHGDDAMEWELRIRLGNVYAAKAQKNDSLKALEELEESKKKVSEYQFSRPDMTNMLYSGIMAANMQLGRYEEAIKAGTWLLKNIPLDSRYPSPALLEMLAGRKANLAECYVETSRLNDADIVLAGQLGPSNTDAGRLSVCRSYLLLARARLKESNSQKARTCCDTVYKFISEFNPKTMEHFNISQDYLLEMARMTPVGSELWFKCRSLHEYRSMPTMKNDEKTAASLKQIEVTVQHCAKYRTTLLDSTYQCRLAKCFATSCTGEPSQGARLASALLSDLKTDRRWGSQSLDGKTGLVLFCQGWGAPYPSCMDDFKQAIQYLSKSSDKTANSLVAMTRCHFVARLLTNGRNLDALRELRNTAGGPENNLDIMEGLLVIAKTYPNKDKQILVDAVMKYLAGNRFPAHYRESVDALWKNCRQLQT